MSESDNLLVFNFQLTMDTPAPRGQIIKNIYLYLVSFVALMMIIFSAADLVNILLRTYVFTKADQNYYNYPTPACPALAPGNTTSTKENSGCINQEEQLQADKNNRDAQRQRDLVRDISLIVVAVPVFAYHWKIIRKREV